jgi:hypothetical protein
MHAAATNVGTERGALNDATLAAAAPGQTCSQEYPGEPVCPLSEVCGSVTEEEHPVTTKIA